MKRAPTPAFVLARVFRLTAPARLRLSGSGCRLELFGGRSRGSFSRQALAGRSAAPFPPAPVQLSAARPSDESAEASRADPLLVGINRFAATFLDPLGKHEFKALDEREDKRGTEGPAEPRPRSSENCGNSTGGGNGEDDGDERQRCPKEHNFVRPFLQRSPEPSARDALEPSKRNDRA